MSIDQRSDPRYRRPLSRAGLYMMSLFVVIVQCVSPAIAEQPLVVILVRHAEKIRGLEDPGLTVEGKLRAAQLAVMLRHSAIEQIHSTNVRRTRNTAAPLAAELGLRVLHYRGPELTDLASKLRKAGGRHLVVGHSGTTTKMVELLGGRPGTRIADSFEFDRLYIVTRDQGGLTQTIMIRYGHPSVGPAVK